MSNPTYEFIERNQNMDSEFYTNACNKGFWDEAEALRTLVGEKAPHLSDRLDRMIIAEKIALIHSELSEALECARKDLFSVDEHIPAHKNFTVEMADARIRIGDLMEFIRRRINSAIGYFAPAVLSKHEYNKTRPFRHNKKL